MIVEPLFAFDTATILPFEWFCSSESIGGLALTSVDTACVLGVVANVPVIVVVYLANLAITITAGSRHV